jgi:hypothetical protein
MHRVASPLLSFSLAPQKQLVFSVRKLFLKGADDGFEAPGAAD